MTGTGFMKCKPIKRSGRSVREARRVMDKEEVLEANNVWSWMTSQMLEKIFVFSASFSVADSMTKSHGFKASMAVLRSIRAMAICA